MFYIFYTYNYLTLCKSMRYVDSVLNNKNYCILYSDLTDECPISLKNDFNIVDISAYNVSNKRGISAYISLCRSTNLLCKTAHGLVNEHDRYTFVIFRDNEVPEATLIHRFSKFNNIQFYLMEEGAGLYAVKRIPTRNRFFKGIIGVFFGISLYSISNNPQGMNDNIKKIICTNPNGLKNKIRKNIILEKEIDIFTEEFSLFFIKAVCGKNYNFQKCKFVFLSQPLLDLNKENNDRNKKYIENLSMILETISKHGKIFLKSHPRDHFNYGIFNSNYVHVCNRKEQKIPFECLYKALGEPQIITPFSSACLFTKNEKKNIFVFELLNIENVKATNYTSNYFKDNNIICAKSIEELETSLQG